MRIEFRNPQLITFKYGTQICVPYKLRHALRGYMAALNPSWFRANSELHTPNLTPPPFFITLSIV